VAVDSYGSPLEVLERLRKKREMLEDKPTINININLGDRGKEKNNMVIPVPSA
jgi:hypothetical protein